MSGTDAQLEIAACSTCQHRFVRLDGVCPRCASSEIEPMRVPAVGTVLASTEVVYPAEGWPAPHLLVLVELAQSVRVLLTSEAPLPSPGEVVGVVAESGRLRAVPARGAEGKRGEGDSPKRRTDGASFEPPR